MFRHKIVFAFLCLAMIILNGYIRSSDKTFSIGGAFRWSLIWIPIWSLAGIVLAQIVIFSWKILKPDEQLVLSIWRMANLGLAIGIIFKFTFGILFQ